MKKPFIVVYGILQVIIVFAQSLPLETIAANGGWEEKEISLQWTIGESLIHFDEPGTISLSEGFHQLLLRDRDLKKEAEVRAELSPNPVSDQLLIEIDNEGLIFYRLFNSVGQFISNGQFEQQHTLDVSALAAGVYFINFRTNIGFRKTFILEKM